MEALATRPRRARLGHPLQRCTWLDFPVMHDARGNLSVVENGREVPFDIRRIYYLYDIPPQAERAGHAHRALQQVFVAMSGSFDLHLDDGVERRTVHLCRSHRGYLVQPWVWRTLDNFSGASVCLVLASLPYDESDYIRDYRAFRALAGQQAAYRRGPLVQ
jgi:hypothetical protein